MEILQFLVYAVFIFSLIAYTTLDGFDLGVGCLHLFARGNQERRLMINAIGPVWDGNATWIVIGGGVLFAGFPKVFSVLGSNFYLPVMGMIFGFMLRAASIEFRGKKEGKGWRKLWDFCFFLASFVLASLVGIVLGNLIQGIPLNEKGVVVGGLPALLGPYPLLISVFGLVTFCMHGSIYLLMKTEGHFHRHLRSWAKRCIGLFLIFWIIATIATFFHQPHMILPFKKYPVLIVFPLLSFGIILAIPHYIKRGKEGTAFICSSLSIFFLILLYAIGTFPNLVTSTLNPEQNSLTFMNSSVSYLALVVLVIVSACGIPLFFFYAPYIYRIFRGKVRLDSSSY